MGGAEAPGSAPNPRPRAARSALGPPLRRLGAGNKTARTPSTGAAWMARPTAGSAEVSHISALASIPLACSSLTMLAQSFGRGVSVARWYRCRCRRGPCSSRGCSIWFLNQGGQARDGLSAASPYPLDLLHLAALGPATRPALGCHGASLPVPAQPGRSPAAHPNAATLRTPAGHHVAAAPRAAAKRHVPAENPDLLYRAACSVQRHDNDSVRRSTIEESGGGSEYITPIGLDWPIQKMELAHIVRPI